MAIFASFISLLCQFYTVSSSICDYIFLFFALCVAIATNEILQSNYQSKK